MRLGSRRNRASLRAKWVLALAGAFSLLAPAPQEGAAADAGRGPGLAPGVLQPKAWTSQGAARESIRPLAPSSLASSPVWSFEPNLAGVNLGTSVATDGDVNGDGLSDLLATAPGATSGTARVWLFLGSSSGTPSLAPGFPIDSLLGIPVAAPAGDLNGDGYGDIAVGLAQLGSTNGGAFRVYYENASGVNTASPFVVAPVGVGGLGCSMYDFLAQFIG